MKRKYLMPLTSITAFVLLLVTGCQKLSENPKANLTPGTYFKSQNDLDAAVAGMYIQLARDGPGALQVKKLLISGPMI